jgi:pyruvate/2-oxoglutarate/acetoin dehydrogenase E1 component/TPP-dependent pyruvate/acetoin dehydrogenase alpha subunit
MPARSHTQSHSQAQNGHDPIEQVAAGALSEGDLPLPPQEILADYRLAFRSRQASLIGRREVLSGRGKFGIFGDGKEVAQLAMARAFRPGDFRSGYYRDQTFALATGVVTLHEFFAQLYGHADAEAEPATGGRSMNAHFGTRSLRPDGSWRDLTAMPNAATDVSPTAAQMPRLVGLGQASTLFRSVPELAGLADFSHNGDEVAFGTIGNASCAEGLFWESLNAIVVLGSPVVLSIWDDGYGISVPNEHQIARSDLSALLQGFRRRDAEEPGLDLYTVPGWDYPGLLAAYAAAAETARRDHVPAVVHVTEMTQPQGHSTSGSHERYKTPERLAWEEEADPLRRMRAWMIDRGVADVEVLETLEQEERRVVERVRREAWEAFLQPIRQERQEVAGIIEEMAAASAHGAALAALRRALLRPQAPLRRQIFQAAHRALLTTRDETMPARQRLMAWSKRQRAVNAERFGSHLYSESAESALLAPATPADYSEGSPLVAGYEILNACFDAALARDPRVIAFGEDVGLLGGVNQAFAGLQEKYGPLRVMDTGIREATIVGQAIGLAMRGLRPIADIQYLDYLLYALQILSDDLATLHWRSVGGQKAPVIVRTRGHRLEGIWHSGSPMAGIMHHLRGMHVIVPRNMVQAAGFYNTMLLSDEPALIVEVLNGYRLKERLPDNIDSFTLPLGVPEVLREGDDVTLVTYGAMCRLALEAADLLAEVGVSLEVIDVRTLLPFDLPHLILQSLKKTSRIVFADEDVPGGATATMLQEVLENQGGYWWLDAEPRTLTARPHRAAYGSDGDYFSKPNVEDIFRVVYDLMNEADPVAFPLFYR